MSTWKRNFASSEVSVNVFVYVSVSGRGGGVCGNVSIGE